MWVSPAMCGLGACLETNITKKHVLLRTTSEPEKEIVVTKEEWEAFIESVKQGQYDY